MPLSTLRSVSSDQAESPNCVLSKTLKVSLNAVKAEKIISKSHIYIQAGFDRLFDNNWLLTFLDNDAEEGEMAWILDIVGRVD